MSGSSSLPPGAASANPDEPLGLTVHSMPTPQEAMRGDAQRTVLGRLKMLAVLAVCAAPVVASYFTYYVVRPETRRSFGELIEPQRPLPSINGVGLDGKLVPLTDLRHQWLLVSVAGGACRTACEHHLYLQRQLREGLGRDKDRLEWVWLVRDSAPVAASLQPALAQSRVLRVDPTQLAQWLPAASGQSQDDHLYVVDPMGNLMMRFPASLDRSQAPRAKRDLERLMRASASWDQAGRPEKRVN